MQCYFKSFKIELFDIILIIPLYPINELISGGVPTGIDPSLLTSAAFELVQASQALQAVQAVQPLLHAESPPMMTPLTQVRFIISEHPLYNYLTPLGPILAI